MTQGGSTESGTVVVRGGALGDHVLTLPAIAHLRDASPGAPLDWIGHPTRSRLARPRFVADADGPVGLSLFSEETDSHLALPFWVTSADRIVVYCPDPSPIVNRLRSHCAAEVSGWDPRPSDHAREHMTAHLLRGVGYTPEPQGECPRFTPGQDELDDASRYWRQQDLSPDRVVLLHAGSGGRAKCWSPEGFEAVGHQLAGDGWSIALLEGPAETERPGPYAALRQRWPVVGAADPLQLAARLALVRGLIGNDSGPAHLAAAAGTATLSLFGPTDPELWRPLGPDSSLLRAPQGQLERLSVPQVVDAARQMLAT